MVPFLIMVFIRDASDKDTCDAYERHFRALAIVAQQLNVPAEEVDSLIADVLLTTLTHRRPIADVEKWLAAALTFAVRHREQH